MIEGMAEIMNGGVRERGSVYPSFNERGQGNSSPSIHMKECDLHRVWNQTSVPEIRSLWKNELDAIQLIKSLEGRVHFILFSLSIHLLTCGLINLVVS